MRFAFIVVFGVSWSLAAEVYGQDALPNLKCNLPSAPASPMVSTLEKSVEKQADPAYRVRPTDVISIEMLIMNPRPPYNIGIYDMLRIRVTGASWNNPFDFYLVEGDGTVNFGPNYGKVRVAGMKTEEAAKVIHSKLQEQVPDAKVTANIARTAGAPHVTGRYLIRQDGTIRLNTYGTLRLAGKTTKEIKLAVQQRLEKQYDSPDVSVEVLGDRQKVINVVNKKSPQSVRRLPLSTDGLLAVIEAEGGSSQISANDQMWLAQPRFDGSGEFDIERVEMKAIIKDKSAAKRCQLVPDSSVFLFPPETSNTEKITAETIRRDYWPLSGPFYTDEERNRALQQINGMGWIRGYQTLGRSYNSQRAGF
jgi:polysaccharide biosynthesis/export protein